MELRHELNLPPEFEAIKNPRKLFSMVDRSKDDSISLYEWLNLFGVFDKVSDGADDEPEEESNDLDDVDKSREVLNMRNRILEVVKK